MNHVGKLQEIMVKEHITPIYEFMENNSDTRIGKFTMRLSCKVTPSGPINIICGTGSSKQAAKQAAASTFLKKYLNNNNNNSNDDVSTQVQKQKFCAINVKSLKEKNLLQIICANNNSGNPEYVDVLQTGPSHAPRFTVACKVGNSRMEGEGLNKADARVNAASNMLQALMEAQDIYEIFESAQPQFSDINSEIVRLNDNITGNKTPNQIGIFGRKLRSVSPVQSTSLEIRSRSSTSKPALFKSKSEVRENDENISNSVGRLSLKDTYNNDFETKVVLYKKKSKSLNNSSNCVEKKGASTSSTLKKDTEKKIDRVLENVENQLYNEIRDISGSRNLIVRKNVTILFNEFDVIINQDTHAKITDGCNVCTDKSIRIACLSKLLMDLKEYVTNHS